MFHLFIGFSMHWMHNWLHSEWRKMRRTAANGGGNNSTSNTSNNNTNNTSSSNSASSSNNKAVKIGLAFGFGLGIGIPVLVGGISILFAKCGVLHCCFKLKFASVH